MSPRADRSPHWLVPVVHESENCYRPTIDLVPVCGCAIQLVAASGWVAASSDHKLVQIVWLPSSSYSYLCTKLLRAGLVITIEQPSNAILMHHHLSELVPVLWFHKLRSQPCSVPAMIIPTAILILPRPSTHARHYARTPTACPTLPTRLFLSLSLSHTASGFGVLHPLTLKHTCECGTQLIRYDCADTRTFEQ